MCPDPYGRGVTRSAVLALCLAVLAAGCLGLGADALPPESTQLPAGAPLDLGESVRAFATCEGACFEPSIAVDAAGRVYVAEAPGRGRLAVAPSPEAPFVPMPLPPASPDAALGGEGDRLVQTDPLGRVWVTALAARGADGFTGVRVMASSDGGTTWPVDHVLPLAPRTDRQWLLVDDADVVYLTYKDLDAGFAIARSDDGGATFREPVYFVDSPNGIQGRGVVLDSHRIAVPYFRYDAADAGLFVALSDDRGETWTHVMAAPPSASGIFFPSLTRDDDEDAVHLAWLDFEGRARTLTSRDDGVTWGEGRTWSLPEHRVIASPWLEAATGRLAMAYHATTKGEEAPWLHLVVLEDETVQRAAVAGPFDAPADSERPANTDFAHLAALPDGRFVVAYDLAHTDVQVRAEAGEPSFPLAGMPAP